MKKNLHIIFSLVILLGALLQFYGLTRYLKRFPANSTGITIYVITILAFLIMALGQFLQWRKNKKNKLK